MFLTDHLVWFVPSGERKWCSDILFIKPDKLGDFIVWLDAAREYRGCFPSRKFVLIADHSWAELAAAIGWWDEVWPLDFAKFGNNTTYRLGVLTRIRRRGFDTVVAFARSFRYTDVLVKFSGARCKIGPDGNESMTGRGAELRISDRWFTKIVKCTPRRSTTALKMNLDFARAVGCKGWNPRLPSLPRSLYANAQKFPTPGPYVVFVLGAALSGRCWPFTKFAELADRIINHYPFSIVLCGAPAERHLAISFKALMKNGGQQRIIDFVGQTSITELPVVLKGAAATISNETGTLHMSVATGTLSICIAGGGDFGHLVPYRAEVEIAKSALPITVFQTMLCYGCGWHCIHDVPENDPMPCITAISVEQVWAAFTSIMNRKLTDSRL